MPHHPNQGILEKGRHRAILIRELALGATSPALLAKRFGVSVVAVNNFEIRHAAEVAEARESLESEWVGLWVADKYNRIAELQQIIEDLNELAADLATNPEMGPADRMQPIKVLPGIYRQIAEELGQIPKPTVEPFLIVPPQVQYSYPGVDPEKLG